MGIEQRQYVNDFRSDKAVLSPENKPKETSLYQLQEVGFPCIESIDCIVPVTN